MLPDLYKENSYKILGMDPGSNKFGFGIIDCDIKTDEILSSTAWTLDLNNLLESYPLLVQNHGERASKLYALKDYLTRIFYVNNPLYIASEAPFINHRFPQAGIALTEVLTHIRLSVIEYDPTIELEIVPPSTVKNAVKAKGNADKDEMKKQVCLLNIKYSGILDIIDLDEHSIDGLAVAYAKWSGLFNKG